MKLISFVIPAYNSEKTLKELCENINHTMEKYDTRKNKFFWDIIIVNDFSKDGTKKVIENICEENSNVKGITLLKNYGQQNALYCGIINSLGDYIITMDDDFQNPPELIPIMIEKIEDGFDLVYGIPIKNKKFNFRYIGTFIREEFFRRNFKNLKNMKVSSYRIFRRELKENIEEYNYQFIYISCLLLKRSNKVGNIMYKYTERKIGKSNYSIKSLVKILFNLNIYYGNNKYLVRFRKKGKPFIIEEKINF